MSVKRRLDYDAFGVIEASASNTPDWDTLRKSKDDEFVIFVTGNMRKNRCENYLLNGANYYGKATTWNEDYIMKRIVTPQGANKPAEPCVFHLPEKDKILWKEVNHIFQPKHLKKIEGDVYGVPLRTLATIDKMEGNGEEVNRELHWIDFHEQKQLPKSAKAYMYTVNIEFWLDNYVRSEEMYLCNMIEYSNKTKAYYFS